MTLENKQYLKISNKGVIDPKGLYLLGASTKKNNNDQIGKFGTGNKYAIPYFLRNNIDIKIFAGTREVPIEIKNVDFREESFNVIKIDDIETSLTTSMGQDEWEYWQAIREIYANALDEGDLKISVTNVVKGKEDTSSFYIEYDNKAKEFYKNFDKYFSKNREPIYTTSIGEIYPSISKSCNIYVNGIRAYNNSNKKSAFDYNFYDIDIGEDRIVKYGWYITEGIYEMLQEVNDEKNNFNITKEVLRATGKTDYIERNSTAYKGMFTNKNILKNISKFKVAPKNRAGHIEKDITKFVLIDSDIYDKIQDKLPEECIPEEFRNINNAGEFSYKEIDDKYLNFKLKEAKDFLDEAQINIPYPIRIVEFDNKDILGKALTKDKEILISENILSEGSHLIAQTIIEEFIHIKYDAEDETRKFQDSIFKEFISYIEKTRAYILT